MVQMPRVQMLGGVAVRADRKFARPIGKETFGTWTAVIVAVAPRRYQQAVDTDVAPVNQTPGSLLVAPVGLVAPNDNGFTAWMTASLVAECQTIVDGHTAIPKLAVFKI